MEGKKTAGDRLAAKGYQDPGLGDGNVGIAGCVGRRASRLQLISLGAMERWKIRSLDIENAILRADRSDREVHLRAPGQ